MHEKQTKNLQIAIKWYYIILQILQESILGTLVHVFSTYVEALRCLHMKKKSKIITGYILMVTTWTLICYCLVLLIWCCLLTSQLLLFF